LLFVDGQVNIKGVEFMSHLGDAFKTRRLERKLTTGQLARLVGYRNLGRGSNRIQRFEGGGKIAADLLGKLATVLEIHADDVRRYAAADYKDWCDWANEPIRPYLVLRLMAAIYQPLELPDDALTPEAAEAYAARLARERKLMVCLVLSRRLSVYFDGSGQVQGRMEASPDVPCEPFAVIGGKRVQFDFSGGAVLRPIDEPGVSS
jgi:hypothetical protein